LTFEIVSTEHKNIDKYAISVSSAVNATVPLPIHWLTYGPGAAMAHEKLTTQKVTISYSTRIKALNIFHL